MTSTLTRGLLAGALILGLGACGTFTSDRIASTAAMAPTGTAFNAALQKEYVALAKAEASEKHYSAADLWISKASAAAGGNVVEPERPGSWKLPAGTEGDISAARGRLMAALDGGAWSRAPGHAAHAQAMLDCWIEEQEENHQPADIAACRAAFEDALAQLKPPPPPPPPPPAPAPAPKPIQKTVMETFIVYFAHDSAEISAEGRTTIGDAVASLEGAKSFRIWVRGHTDRSGSDSYNEGLAERRADEVAFGLMDTGAPANKINMRILGETTPAVSTADGVREGLNRRVEINVDKKIEVMPAK